MSTPIYYSDINTAFSIDPTNNIILVTNADCINQNIKTLLSTIPGERIMEPTFGCDISSLMFEPIDTFIASEYADAIQTAITAWEDRVAVTSIDIVPNPDQNIYQLYISYVVHVSGQSSTFAGKVPILT